MGKPVAKKASREKSEKLKRISTLIEQAMILGFTTKGDIAKNCNIPLWQVSGAFSESPELRAIFQIMRRTLVDMAADNVQKILEDKEHPQHFQASKYILQTYKSDLDTNLESKDSEEMEATLSGNGGVSPIRITFGVKK
jgi:hypothetical protein